MTAEYARTEWDRALEAFAAATLLLAHGGFDSAASRAYYAAFHAASALFALEGRTFFQTLGARGCGPPRPRQGSEMVGQSRARLQLCVNVRGVGDYGSEVRVDASQAEEATAAAHRILVVSSEAMLENFPRVPEA